MIFGWNGLDTPVLMARPEPLLTMFAIHHRLESFAGYSSKLIHISGTNSQTPFLLILVKNELGAFSESFGPPLSRPYPIMTIAGL